MTPPHPDPYPDPLDPKPPRWVNPRLATSLYGFASTQDLRVWLQSDAGRGVRTRERGASYQIDADQLEPALIAAGKWAPPSSSQPSPTSAEASAESSEPLNKLSKNELERQKLIRDIQHRELLTQVKARTLIPRSEAVDAWTTALRQLRTELDRLGMTLADLIVQRSWPEERVIAEIQAALRELAPDRAAALCAGLNRPATLTRQIRAIIDDRVSDTLQSIAETIR